MGKSRFEIRRLFEEIPFSKLTSRTDENMKEAIFDRVSRCRGLRMYPGISDEELVNSLDGCLLYFRTII